MKDSRSAFNHPYDTPLTSGLRFLVEVIAWVSGPWAAAQLSMWLIFPALIILIGLPSVFSTRGDKRHIVVVTPGPLRVLLEIALHLNENQSETRRVCVDNDVVTTLALV